MSADDFLKVQRDLEDAAVPRRSHPKGWEPGVDTARGTLTVQAGDTPPQTGQPSSANSGWTLKRGRWTKPSRCRSAHGTRVTSGTSTTAQRSSLLMLLPCRWTLRR
jgi:hypothetical protein